MKTMEEWASLIIPVTSDTKISLNGATNKTAEQIMTGLNFKNQLQNIREFVNFRDKYFHETGFYSRISLQLTFLQNNMSELPEIIKLAAQMGIDRIKGHHLWTHFPEIENLSFKRDKKSMQAWNKIVDKAYKTSEQYRKPNGEKILLEQFSYLKSSETKEVPYEYNCPFLTKELWVSASGKISPCCAPDEQRNSLGDFGDYPKTTLLDVLESRLYQDLVKNYKSHPLCKTCVMRKPI
jgi:MoaA/NifB/PqqE/SkfB family radical SAM enzyme